MQVGVAPDQVRKTAQPLSKEGPMTDDRDRTRVETHGLVTGVARRGVLGGLAAGVLAVAGLAEVEAKKGRGKGKGKGKGHGKGKGKQGNGNGTTKVFICHRSGDSFGLIRVGSPATKAHEKHGDIVCEAAGTCQTGDPVACDETTGACIFEQATEGTACTTDLGETGSCDAEGTCVLV
jgi:hypothetical protein